MKLSKSTAGSDAGESEGKKKHQWNPLLGIFITKY